MSHRAWLAQADSDLAAAKVLSASGHHSQAVWLAAQAVEKAHKAILAALGLRYEEHHFKKLSHDTSAISALLPEALHRPTDAAIAEKVSTLGARAKASRYPAPNSSGWTAPSDSFIDSQHEVADAVQLLAWCRQRIERALLAAAKMEPDQA